MLGLEKYLRWGIDEDQQTSTKNINEHQQNIMRNIHVDEHQQTSTRNINEHQQNTTKECQCANEHQ